MAFLKKIFSARGESASDGKIEKKKEEKKIKEEKEVAKPRLESSGQVIVGVLYAAHVTEKTADLKNNNKYVFVVSPTANKVEVKRAVEGRYGVLVREVNILNMPGKERKRGRQIGWKPGFKKAVVTLQEGQSIEIQ